MAIDHITPGPARVVDVVEAAEQLGWTVARREPNKYVQMQKGNDFAILSQAGDRVSVTRTMGNDIGELVKNLGLIDEHDPRYDEWVAGKK